MKGKEHYPRNWYDIDIPSYKRTVNTFCQLTKLLQIHTKLHVSDGQIEDSDILLFNHFARFETVIPQYLIYKHTGIYCCIIASGEFFEKDSALGNYLQHVGVFPHDHPRLFPILAEQMFHGRKVIIFPEGGMVKDRKVVDNKGKYNIFSRSTGIRRKHHTGAGVLAQGVDTFKAIIRYAHKHNHTKFLNKWTKQFKLDNVEQLLQVANKPTKIVPGNITFYPIRGSDNIITKGLKLFNKKLNRRMLDEFIVEGNIMFKDTDIDVRIGTPINKKEPTWINNHLIQFLLSEEVTLDDIFNLHTNSDSVKQKLLGWYLKKNAEEQRDLYAKGLYKNVTINLSHIASSLIMLYMKDGITQVQKQEFHTILYSAIKKLQRYDHINLHRSLLNPYEYDSILGGSCDRLQHFIRMGTASNLIELDESYYYFLPKILKSFDLDTIRTENLIAVYYNEATPINTITETLKNVRVNNKFLTTEDLAIWQLDNEKVALKMEQRKYKNKKFSNINDKETATADPAPFLFTPRYSNGCGILLVHGLLASPAEVRCYGETLCDQGFTVMGPRLSGHGTSPYALQRRTRHDWYGSVKRGFDILKQECDNIVLIGFSTGGILTLKLAAEHGDEINGVVGVSVPVKFVEQLFKYVPTLYHINNFFHDISGIGVKHFIDNSPEHPDINYRTAPINCFYELKQLIDDMKNTIHKIKIPSLLVYADNDPIVSINSANMIFNKIQNNNKKLEIITADHHGILKDNTKNTWGIINNFLNYIKK